MAKRFRVFFAPDDLARIERLKQSLDVENEVSVVRAAMERCMVRCSGPEAFTKAFARRCAAAAGDLSAGAVSQGWPFALALGDRYIGYVKEMTEPLGFRHGSKMIRGVLLMFERGDI